MVDISLVFPPQWTYDSPPANLPVLTAELMKESISTKQYDLNYEFYRSLLNKKSFKYFEIYILDEIDRHLKQQNNLIEYNYLIKLFRAKSINSYIKKEKITLDRMLTQKHEKNSSIMLVEYIITLFLEGVVSLVFSPIQVSKCNFNLGESLATFKELLDYVERFDNPWINNFCMLKISKILKGTKKIIGFSASTKNQLFFSLLLAKYIKAQNKSIHIIVGGSFFSAYVEEVRKLEKLFYYFDSVCVYDGERTIVNLHKHIDNKAFDKVENLIWKKNPEGIIINTPFVSNDINSRQYPDYSDLPINKYFIYPNVLPVAFAKSCFGKCNFCSCRKDSSLGDWQEMHPEKIFDTLEYLSKRYKTKYFYFTDLCTSLNCLDNLCRLIINRKLEIYWSIATRFDERFSLDFCTKLKQAGCLRVSMGMESGDQEILDLMQKNITVNTIKQSLKNLKEAGVLVEIFIIKNYPSEKYHQFENTIKLLRDNINNIIAFSILPYNLVGNSDLLNKSYKDIIEYVKKDTINDLNFHPYELITLNIPQADIEKKVMLLQKLNNDIFGIFINERDNYYRCNFPVSANQQLIYASLNEAVFDDDISHPVKADQFFILNSEVDILDPLKDCKVSWDGVYKKEYFVLKNNLFQMQINEDIMKILKYFFTKVKISTALNTIFIDNGIADEELRAKTEYIIKRLYLKEVLVSA